MCFHYICQMQIYTVWFLRGLGWGVVFVGMSTDVNFIPKVKAKSHCAAEWSSPPTVPQCSPGQVGSLHIIVEKQLSRAPLLCMCGVMPEGAPRGVGMRRKLKFAELWLRLCWPLRVQPIAVHYCLKWKMDKKQITCVFESPQLYNNKLASYRDQTKKDIRLVKYQHANYQVCYKNTNWVSET